MAEENYGFGRTKARLEDIVTQVRKKDVSLEKSLDLLEEGVRLANQCTELIDHADWEAAEAAPESEEAGAPGPEEADAAGSEEAVAPESEQADALGDGSPNDTRGSGTDIQKRPIHRRATRG